MGDERGVDKDDGACKDDSAKRHGLVSTSTENERGEVYREANGAVVHCPLANKADIPSIDKERTCVSDGPRVGAGLLYDQVDGLLTRLG